MIEQNLQSWFWDKSPLSTQIAGFLIKATFLSTNICFSIIVSER